jgi:4-amino-4-deoxy-L-arabinose transferase-like glycosyltransferase
VIVFVIALALRFHQLQELPYGLWRDEARHGLVALRMLEDPGYRPVYVKTEGVDMPALGLYPFALAIKLWGLYPWSMVPITALAGALTVFPIYGVAYQLFRRKDVALLAAAFLAGSSWHLTISRFSFPTIFDPLFGLTGLWLMLWSQGAGGRGQGAGVTGLSSSVLRPPSSVVRPPSSVLRPPSSVLRPSSSVFRLVACFVSGGCIGVALQTYHTGRVVPLIAGILAVCLLVQQRHQWRRWLASMAMVALGFAIVTGPLALHVLNDPNAVNERVSDVFLLSDAARAGRAPLALLDEAIGRHLLMFNVQGDANGRHHAPGRPMLDFITGFGFLIGVTVVARRWRDWRGLFLLAGLGISMLPSALAVDAPHAMRSFGAVAFACIIAALGWAEVWRLMSRANAATSLRRTTNDERRTSRVYVNQEYDKNASQEGVHLLRSAIGMIALALALNYWTYFVEMRFSPTVWTMFYPIHTQMGVYLRAVADEQGPEALRRVYVPEGFADNSVFQYLTHGLPVQTYRNVNVPESAKTGAILLLSGYSYERDAQELMQYIGPQPTPTARGPNLPGIDTPAFVGYETQPIAAGE